MELPREKFNATPFGKMPRANNLAFLGLGQQQPFSGAFRLFTETPLDKFRRKPRRKQTRALAMRLQDVPHHVRNSFQEITVAYARLRQ